MLKKNQAFSFLIFAGWTLLLTYSDLSQAEQREYFDFESSITKLWLWPHSSQIYFLNPQTKSSLILYFSYNEDKSRLTNFDYEIAGWENLFETPEIHKHDLQALMESLRYGKNLSVFLEGPRHVDPLGPQPTEDTELYRKGLWSTGQAKRDKPPARESRLARFIKRHFSGGKRAEYYPVFTRISFPQMRGIIKSNLTQEQIDFEIFRKMILDMVARTPAEEGFRKLLLTSPSCKGLL